jgi:hypothetical protein
MSIKLLHDVILIETFLSFHFATNGDRNKHVMFILLCKYHFSLGKHMQPNFHTSLRFQGAREAHGLQNRTLKLEM